MNKKLKAFLITTGIVGSLAAGVKHQINKMKPAPTKLPSPISLERTLPTKTSNNPKELSIIRYDSGKTQKFAVLTSWNPLIARDIQTNSKSLANLINSGTLQQIQETPEDYLASPQKIKESQILAPITTPTNIIGIGCNYAEHTAEAGEKNTAKFTGKNMMTFRKETNALTGPFDDIKKPQGVDLLDYETELGIVIGKRITTETKITPENFKEFIAGYTLANDVSARDIQLKGGTLFDKAKGFRKGKSYDGFCPTGPIFLYTPKSRDFELNHLISRNEKNYQMQSGDSSEMLNSPFDILNELQKRLSSENNKEYRCFVDSNGNRNTSLEPGDLILSGTPSEVAFKFHVKYVIGCLGKQGFINFEKQNNEKYLQVGDITQAHSSKLGHQRNKITK